KQFLQNAAQAPGRVAVARNQCRKGTPGPTHGENGRVAPRVLECLIIPPAREDPLSPLPPPQVMRPLRVLPRQDVRHLDTREACHECDPRSIGARALST